jgi:BirA family biotin operon repressor/biotin-[acetyl-CoA-carboxylase] ligase
MIDAGRLGHPHVHHRLIDSTNERARQLAAAGAPHGTLVTADDQSAGRGRHGRTWTAPARSALLASVLVRGLDERDALLPLATAVAVCEACEGVAPVSCAIKWPNDIWVDRRKLAGILIEGRPQEGWAVLGIGVNVCTRLDDLPPELRERATSLLVAAAPSLPPARDALLELLLDRLHLWLPHPRESVLAAWRERDALLGAEISWNGGSGTAAGVDDAGALLVDTSRGRLALDAAEVHLGEP